MCEIKMKCKQQDISSGVIKCVKCNKTKNLDNFYSNKNGHYSYTCKECLSEKYKSNSVKKYKQQDISSGVIKCVKCNKIKDLDNFYSHKDGYYDYTCKECYGEKYRSKTGSVKKYKQDISSGVIKCRTCQEDKPLTFFNKNDKGYYNYECNICIKNKRQKIVEQNKIKREEQKRIKQEIILKEKEIRRNKREENKRLNLEKKLEYKNKISEERKIIREEIRIEKERLLREKNERLLREKEEREHKKLIKEQKTLEHKKLMEYYKTDEWKMIKKENERIAKNKKYKDRWENDNLFAIKVRLRNLIRNSFRRKGYKKFNTSTENIVGISYDEFKNYMESKFVDGMNWNNRGEWHIDHIIPLSSAKSEEELVRLCHYTNLQPLWAKDNIEKSNKVF
jgi:hypothetical protein